MMRCRFIALALLCGVSLSAATIQVQVNANQFFNPTGILASPAQLLTITTTGVVNISTLNGGYLTDANGTIQQTPPLNSGSFQFFHDRGAPPFVDPVAGTQRLFTPLSSGLPGHLQNGPYGALVAGFSTNPNPTSFADFVGGLNSMGFVFVGQAGTVVSPATGGYLFLAVNDFNNPGGDNAGFFIARVQTGTIPEPSGAALCLVGLIAFSTWKSMRPR